jgi:hypothetical protein
MLLRTFAALSSAALLAGPARAADAPKTGSSAPRSPIPAAAEAAIVRGATFDVVNVTGAPGVKKTLTATLREESPGNPPLAGKTASFRVSGNGMAPVELKASDTDAEGKTTASYTIPDLAPGNYEVRAAWKGDVGHKPATGVGKLTVVKPPTGALEKPIRRP